MRNTAIKDKAEFEARQQCFEFGAACRFVNDLAISVKNSLKAYAAGVLRNFKMPAAETKKPEQFRLNLMPWLESALIAC